MITGPLIVPGADGTVTTGPAGAGAAPGTGSVPGVADSATVPLGITLGTSNAAVAKSGAWPRTVSGTGRPRVAAGLPSRAAGAASWAGSPPEPIASVQPSPKRMRFIVRPPGSAVGPSPRKVSGRRRG